jgi:PKD repeat protein
MKPGRLAVLSLIAIIACWTGPAIQVFAQSGPSGRQYSNTALAPPATTASSGPATQPNSQSGGEQAPPAGALLAEPVYGTAPLTVDFTVASANKPGQLVYHWDFGDGAVSSLPAGAYIPHTYRRPGTYLCSLTLMDQQGISTTLITTVTVRPRQR